MDNATATPMISSDQFSDDDQAGIPGAKVKPAHVRANSPMHHVRPETTDLKSWTCFPLIKAMISAFCVFIFPLCHPFKDFLITGIFHG